MRLEIPVDPDAETAREWAEDELAKEEYISGGTNWVDDFFTWISNLIASLGDDVGGAFNGWGTLIAIAVAIGLVALVVWIVVGPMRRSRGRAVEDAELGDPTLSSGDLLSSARAAASASDWNRAFIDTYRAVIRSLAEREAIDARPGMTAFEAAIAASISVPRLGPDILADADLFDAVRYGHVTATQANYEHVVATYASAAKAPIEVLA